MNGARFRFQQHFQLRLIGCARVPRFGHFGNEEQLLDEALQVVEFSVDDRDELALRALICARCTSRVSAEARRLVRGVRRSWPNSCKQCPPGTLGADIQALTMNSGYTNFSHDSCIRLTSAAQEAETVEQCFQSPNLSGTNADFDPSDVGKFYYYGGRFQKYAAVDLALGADDVAALTATVSGQVGPEFQFLYNSPQLAAGIETTPAVWCLLAQDSG